jgi:putative ATP-binding cassette transporter
LSTGQKKRLAMVVALLEDRPIYVLDEWAADQDPEFRKHYYEELLPSLKRRGKTIIAISHDDRYFHCADRVVMMDYGKIRAIEKHGMAKVSEAKSLPSLDGEGS